VRGLWLLFSAKNKMLTREKQNGECFEKTDFDQNFEFGLLEDILSLVYIDEGDAITPATAT
jgi:hypothetical protein